MRQSRHFLVLLATAALAISVVLGVVVSCSDNPPPVTPDSGVPDTSVDAATPDIPTIPDQPKPDQFTWPDVKPPSDTWPWPVDSYVGAPFGCQTESDCFGQKCCPTPWGVKLCAPSCDLK